MTVPAENPEDAARLTLLWSENSSERRILILAPTGNDGKLTADFLNAAGLAAVCVPTMEELCLRIEEGCGAVVLAEEVMNHSTAVRFFSLLQRQPKWSDLPVALITTAGVEGAERIKRLTALGLKSNVTLLERPFRPTTLISTLKAALSSRERQYEVRALLDEVVRARDSAERASRAKDEFLAALSHELRTPLNPVLLIATENAEDRDLPEQVRADFAEIVGSVTLEARLIDDLLDLTRITQRKLSLGLASVDAHAAIHAALETTKVDLDAKALTVELGLNAGLTTIRADPVRMQQVLWNVLKNAAKFTPAQGHIKVETAVNGTDLEIKITDSGVGMDTEELAQIFEAFAQGKHANNGGGHRFGGLGLGLAISRQLMELHQGAIWALSDGPGKGSTFVVRFPLVFEKVETTPAVEIGAGSRSAVALKIRRLLLVEDHKLTRISLRRLLERRGYEVEAAGSLAEARAALATGKFELLLSDLGLPDGSGYELMDELGNQPNLKAIALSGYGMESDLAQSFEKGFSAHLTKPVTVQALDAALAAV